MLCTHSTEKLLGLKRVIVKHVRQVSDKTEIFIASAIVFFTCSMFQRKMEQLSAAPSGVFHFGLPQLLT